jgi:hypothetical protein
MRARSSFTARKRVENGNEILAISDQISVIERTRIERRAAKFEDLPHRYKRDGRFRSPRFRQSAAFKLFENAVHRFAGPCPIAGAASPEKSRPGVRRICRRHVYM